ncbi:MAG: APC family permease, partial [Halapricum sp.]
SKGVPLTTLSVVLSGLLLVGGGIGIAIGAFPVVSAGLIAVFFVVTTPTMHDFWRAEGEEHQQELTHFLKNVVLLGAALVFVAFGLTSPMFSGAEFQPLFSEGTGAAAVLPAMGLTFIAFEGYDLITTVTEEVENPRENIPKAIFISLVATVIVYLTVVTVAVGTLGAEGLADAGEAGIATAATSFMPTGLPVIQNGGALIVFGAVFSTLTALNAVVIASSRVAFSMGREGQLLPSFGQLHHRYGTPFVAILASAVVMLASVALPTQSAGNMSSLFFLLSFIIVNVAVIRLRRERPNMNRPYEMPFYPAPPVIGVVLNLILTGVLVEYLFRTDPLALVLSVGWIILGGIGYVALNRLKAPPKGELTGTDTDITPKAED